MSYSSRIRTKGCFHAASHAALRFVYSLWSGNRQLRYVNSTVSVHSVTSPRNLYSLSQVIGSQFRAVTFSKGGMSVTSVTFHPVTQHTSDVLSYGVKMFHGMSSQFHSVANVVVTETRKCRSMCTQLCSIVVEFNR